MKEIDCIIMPNPVDHAEGIGVYPLSGKAKGFIKSVGFGITEPNYYPFTKLNGILGDEMEDWNVVELDYYENPPDLSKLAVDNQGNNSQKIGGTSTKTTTKPSQLSVYQRIVRFFERLEERL